MSLQKLKNYIIDAKSIAILPHVNADGDSVGSSLALGLVLEKLGKEVSIYFEEKIPSTFSFLEGMHLVRYDIETDLQKDRDIVIAVDSGDLERLGRRQLIFNSSKFTINIDHHGTNTKFANENFVNKEAASTGEIIYYLIKELGNIFDKNVAECLYVAIISDTGGFRYSNTTSDTHRIAADLLEFNVDVNEISRRVFDTISYKKLKLIGFAAANIELLEEGRLSYLYIPYCFANEIGASDEDFDGVVNIGSNIAGVEVSIMIREKRDGDKKVNLRSKKVVDVSDISCSFGGGGHFCAAGFTTFEDIDSLKNKLIAQVRTAFLQKK